MYLPLKLQWFMIYFYKIMELNKLQTDMILKHMWPLTLKLPRYRESYILTLVDKYCALSESFHEIAAKFKKRKSYKYD